MSIFEELESLNTDRFDSERNQRVQQRINDTLSTYRFLGQMVDIYLPRMLDTFVEMTGGRRPNEPHPHRRTPTDRVGPGTGSPSAPSGPGGPSGGNDIR